MSRRKITALAAALLFCLALVGYGLRATAPANIPAGPPRRLAGEVVDWEVIDAGGDPVGSTRYTVTGSLGQPSSGAAGSTGYRVGLGYWYMAAVPVPPTLVRIYLPAVRTTRR